MFTSQLLVHNKKSTSTMPDEEKWLRMVNQILDANISNVNFGNEHLAKELNISKRQLFRKMKEITNLPPKTYLRQRRLNLARKLLMTGKYRTVNETAFAVGYVKVSYFIFQFEKEFGKKPLSILQEYNWR